MNIAVSFTKTQGVYELRCMTVKKTSDGNEYTPVCQYAGTVKEEIISRSVKSIKKLLESKK